MLKVGVRSIVIAGLYLLLGIFVCASFFYYPRHDRRLFLSMLPGSSIIVDISEPSLNIPVAIENPLVAALIDVGFGQGYSAYLSEDENLSSFLRVIRPERLVIGALPAYGRNYPEAFYAAGYIGWRARIVGALLSSGWIPGAGRLSRTESGSCYMTVQTVMGERAVGLAVVDGILLAAISDDPDMVSELTLRIRYTARPAELMRFAGMPWREKRSARAWIAEGGVGGVLYSPAGLSLSVENLTADNISLTIEGRDWCRWIYGECKSVNALKTDAISPSVPGSVIEAAFPGSSLTNWMELFFPGIVAMMGLELSGDLCLRFTGEPYGGTVSGLHVPVVSLSVPLAPGEEEGDWLPVLLDRINAETGMGFWAQRNRGDQDLYTFAHPEGTFYESFEGDERFGFSVVPGRAVFASSISALINGIGEFSFASSPDESSGDTHYPCRFALFTDIHALHTELENLLAVWRMGEMSGVSSSKSAGMRNRIASFNTFLTKISPLKELRLLINRIGVDDRMQLTFGLIE